MADAKGYTTSDAVGVYLGVPLTPAQAAAVEALLPAVEQTIDDYTGHTWLTGPILGEQILPARPTAYLRAIPVLSVEAVTLRWPFDRGGAPLVAGQDYELVDAAHGRLLTQPYGYCGYGGGWSAYRWPTPYGGSEPWLVVDYTPGTSLPASVEQAATMIAADALGPQLAGITSAVEAFTITGQLSVKLRDGGEAAVPPEARRLLDPLRDAPIVLA
jgi:hypothetical protein